MPKTGVSVKEVYAGKSDANAEITQFNVGSIFAVPMDMMMKGQFLISIASDSTLIISTAVLNETDTISRLVYGGMTICHLTKERPIVTGLELTCSGPTEIMLCVKGAQVNVFGSVIPNTTIHAPQINGETIQKSVNDEHLSIAQVETSTSVVEEKVTKPLDPTATKKRKLHKVLAQEVPSPEPSALEIKNDQIQEEVAPEKLSKKQRRALAKQKAKELEEAVATLNKHETKQPQATLSKPKYVPSITKERRLKGGVLVRDFVVGTGALVKPGRKLSVLYEGRFPDGKVFDRNKSKANPLVFRQGTAQVVRGLEQGMEGMKVGGEREITIPPELGYGEKGSGAVIPPNSTLIFSVQLLSMG